MALELLYRARQEEHGPYTPLAHLGLGMTLHYLGDLADAASRWSWVCHSLRARAGVRTR
jgi:hypothetical protein